MNRKQTFVVAVALSAMACFGFERTSFAQVKTVEGGALNGKATVLPKPPLPPNTKILEPTTVVVEIIVGKNGTVESVRALSGPTFLYEGSLAAARASRFSPTLLSGSPVNVRGTLSYTFAATPPSSINANENETTVKDADWLSGPTPASSSVEFQSDDLIALNAFFKANIYKKGPYEKTADYEAKLESLIGQKIAGSLTGKSVWTYYQRLGAIQYASTEFDPDSELAEIHFWGDFNTELIVHSKDDFLSGKIPTSYDALTGYHTRLSHLLFLGDYSNLAGLNDSDTIKRVKFQVSPAEARAIGFGDPKSKHSMPLMLRITFVPKSPYRAYEGAEGDRIYGRVQSLSVVNSETGKVYSEIGLPSKTPNRSSNRNTASTTRTGYDRFLGEWTFLDSGEKRYFRVTRDRQGRFQFEEGSDDRVPGKIVWDSGIVMLTGADGIFLKPLKEKLHAKFISANFRATHGMDFTYHVTLQIQANGKVLYLLGGDLQEKHIATKIDEN